MDPKNTFNLPKIPSLSNLKATEKLYEDKYQTTYRCSSKVSSEILILKIFPNIQLQISKLEKLKQAISDCLYLNHPNIIHYRKIILEEKTNTLILVMDEHYHGESYNYLREKQNVKVTPSEAYYYFLNLLTSYEYLKLESKLKEYYFHLNFIIVNDRGVTFDYIHCKLMQNLLQAKYGDDYLKRVNNGGFTLNFGFLLYQLLYKDTPIEFDDALGQVNSQGITLDAIYDQYQINKTLRILIKNKLTSPEELQHICSGLKNQEFQLSNLKNIPELSQINFCCLIGNLQGLEILLNNKKNQSNLKSLQNMIYQENIWCPLFICTINGYINILKYFLNDFKINVNVKIFGEWTLFLYSTRYNQLEIIKYLIKEHYIDINQRLNDGCGAMVLAAEKGHLNVLKYFGEILNQDFNEATYDGSKAISYAASFGRSNIVKYLIEERGMDPQAEHNQGVTLLIFASSSGHLDLVKYLVEVQKVDVNQQSHSGWTALIASCVYGHLEVMNYLLQVGKADLSLTTVEGWTPLIAACSRGNFKIIKELIEGYKVDPNAQDYRGMSPSHICDDIKIARYLVENVEQLDISIENIYTYNPLQFAEALQLFNIADYYSSV